MNMFKGAKVAFLIIFYIKIMNFFLKFLCLDQSQNFTKPNPTTIMIFLTIIFFIFHTNNPTIKEHSNSSSPFDELSSFIISEIPSIPFLDPSTKYSVPIISAPCDLRVNENILMEGSNILDERGDAFNPPLLLLEYKNMHTEDEAERIQQEKHPVDNKLIISFGSLHDEIGYDNRRCDRRKSITIYDDGAEMDEYSNYDACQCGYEGDSEDNGYSKHDGLNKIFEEFIAANKRVWREDLIKEKSLYLEG